jgi:hypothetical protein
VSFTRWLRLPWAYRYDGGRDLRLDFLRGYALLVMIVDHLFLNQSAYYPFTFQGKFYTTAAEGFFFISAFVLGMISARLSLTQALRRLVKRTGELYLAAVSMGLGFAALGWFTDLKLWENLQTSLPQGSSAGPFILDLLKLRQYFHGSEVLALYVALMLLGLPALWLCFKRLGWLALLLSIAGYILGQVAPINLPMPMYFYPLSFQLLFTGGLVLGYHRNELSTWMQERTLKVWRLPRGLPVDRLVSALNMLILAIFILFTGLYATQYRLWPALPRLLGEVHVMAPLRLALTVISLYSFYLLTTWLWKPLQAGLGWLLLTLGGASLWSYLAHFVVIVAVFLNYPGFGFYNTIWAGAALHTLVIGIVWGSVKLQLLLPKGAWRRVLATGLIGAALVIPYIERGTRPYQYIDDQDPVWTWQGPWESYQDGDAFNGTHHSVSELGARCELTFTGTGMDLYGYTSPKAGKIIVTLDGQDQGRYNLRSFIPIALLAHFRYKIYSIRNLAPGVHQLKIETVNGGFVVIDYLRVKTR